MMRVVFTALIVAMALLAACEAQEHRQLADTALNAGRPGEAVHHYREALRADPGLANRPAFAENYRLAQRDQALSTARDAVRQQNWFGAVTEYRRALELDPDHTGASMQLTRVRAAAADHYHQQALDHADHARLDRAREAINASLQFDPDHPAANAALNSFKQPDPAVAQAMEDITRTWRQDKRVERTTRLLDELIEVDRDFLPARAARFTARAQLEQARRLLRQAAAQADTGLLEAALGDARRSRDIWPHNPELGPLVERIERERAAAQQLADLAHEELQAGQLDKAQHHFAAALERQADLAAARAGMAQVARTHLAQAERDNHWGRALVWRMAVREYDVGSSDGPALRQARRRLLGGAGADLLIDARVLDADGAAFASDLAAELRRRTGETLIVNPSRVVTDRPRYRVRIADVDFHADRQLVRTRQLEQPYQDERTVPNEKLDDLRRSLRLERELEQTLRRQALTDRELWESRRDALGPNPTDAEKWHVYQLHERMQRSWERYKDQLHAVEDIVRALESEPLTLTQTVERRWPYNEYTYRLTARVEARGELLDAAADRVIHTIAVDKSFSADDTTIDSPRPSIGLHADPLSLPSSASVRRTLMPKAVAEAADAVRRAALRAQVAHLHDRGRTHASAGRTEQALDARIAAALLTEQLDPAAGRKALDEIRAQVTRAR